MIPVTNDTVEIPIVEPDQVVQSLDQAGTERVLAGMLPELVGYFLRRLPDPDDAADAAADTLVILLRRPARLPDDLEGLRRYTYGVARKVCANARRGKLRRTRLAEQLKAELREHDLVATPQYRDAEFAEAVARLSEKDRELLLLIAWEGFGVAEAGAMLKLSPAAARQRYSRIRARLREELTD